jgi:hypothetical protein
MLSLATLFAMLLFLFALVEKSIIIVGPFAGWNYPKEQKQELLSLAISCLSPSSRGTSTFSM